MKRGALISIAALIVVACGAQSQPSAQASPSTLNSGPGPSAAVSSPHPCAPQPCVTLAPTSTLPANGLVAYLTAVLRYTVPNSSGSGVAFAVYVCVAVQNNGSSPVDNPSLIGISLINNTTGLSKAGVNWDPASGVASMQPGARIPPSGQPNQPMVFQYQQGEASATTHLALHVQYSFDGGTIQLPADFGFTGDPNSGPVTCF
jgi:hypothetical protein